MNKFKVTHRANKKQTWEVQEIETTCPGVGASGALVICDAANKVRNLFAAGQWVRVERIDPQPPVE